MKLRYHISKLLMFGAAIASLSLASCSDDVLRYGNSAEDIPSRAIGAGTNTGGLLQQNDGTWLATRRVPLVGYGRMVNNVANSTVSVGAIGDESDKIVNLDLTDCYSPSTEVLGATVAYGQIASVRDINRVYAGGQIAGFLIKGDASNVLDLKVLKGFCIETYLKGERQEIQSVTDESSLLDLGVGNIATGADNTRVVEMLTTKPFDEVRLCKSGVNATAANSLNIYYAYVGESPKMPAVNDGEYSWYFNRDGIQVTFNDAGSWYSKSDQNALIDNKLDNGITVETVGGLIGGIIGGITGGNAGPVMAVNFNQDIPAGSEVGFYMTSGEALSITLANGAGLWTLDENGDVVEEAVNVGILGIKAAGGGQNYISIITTKPCRQVRLALWGINITAGAQVYRYAYVREPAKVDASSYYSASNVTVYNPNYQFPKAYVGEVTYTLVSGPADSDAAIATINGETVLTGMNITGPYIIKAHYVDPSGFVVEQEFTVTRGLNNQILCENSALINRDGKIKYEAYTPKDGFNGLEIIGANSANGSLDAIVDEDTDNKIEFQNNLSVVLAANKPLVGVKTVDGSSIKGSIRNARVGFVVENNTTFLKADVLKYLHIKLYKGDKEVDGGIAKGAVSVGLIKNNNTNQTLSRLSVNTSEEFDRIELYAAQPVTIDLATKFGVFYAFCEDELLECSNPGDDCMQLITNANYGATPAWKVSGLATVATNVVNLSYIVDSDINTYGTIVSPVDAADAAELSVKFNTIEASPENPQTVGFIIKTDVNVLDLIGVTQLFAYNDGKEVAKISKFGTLDVELTSDKAYFPITVDAPFNELRLVKGKGVSVGDGMNICGLFIKPDIDGDGILDCITDEIISGVKDFTGTKDICVGQVPDFYITGAQPDYPFFIKFFEAKSGDKPVFTYRVRSTGDNMTESHQLIAWNEGDENAFYEFCNSNVNAGQYTVRFYSSEFGTEDDAYYMEIHPLQTAWKGGESADWTNWDNWDNGEPWECTDVVVPADTKYYPILKDGNDYRCQNIHFESGAQLTGQNNLAYTNVFVDYAFRSDDYQLFSSPLREMVTGDMFIAKDGWNLASGWNVLGKWGSFDNYFTAMDENYYGENRGNPIIYQRFWDEDVTNVTMSRAASGLILSSDFNDWSRSFNALSTKYTQGQGIAVKVSKNGANATMHFPKSHTKYHYFDASGITVLKDENIKRGDKAGRFWTDGVKKMADMTVPLKRQAAGNIFLFGNPFMSKLNVGELKKANNGITSVQKYENGKYSQMNDNEFVMPMQAVFIITESKVKTYNLKFSESVFPKN